MASIFGHALTAYTAHTLNQPRQDVAKWLWLSVFCACIPDADVLMFDFGFSYGHWLGHRGFFHSICFAFMLAVMVRLIFYRKVTLGSIQGLGIILYFALLTTSHGLLDAMTTGGRGIAFFSPFDHTRHFLPMRVIQVSPLGAGRFFSEWGLAVLKSEFIFIGIPCLLIITLKRVFNRLLQMQFLSDKH